MTDAALLNKMKIKPGMRLLVLQPPAGYLERLDAAPTGFSVETAAQGTYDAVQVFVRNRQEALDISGLALAALKPDGLLWMAYPKGTSKIKTDINRDAGWDPFWQAGFVAIAAISIDDTWSALRFRPSEKVKRRDASQ
jgi:hypothetical protein